jgi:hypothetical protein
MCWTKSRINWRLCVCHTSKTVARSAASSYLNIDFARTVGLVCRRGFPAKADSSNAICGINLPSGEGLSAAVEVKTMTANGAIEACGIAGRYGRFSHLLVYLWREQSHPGGDDRAIFREVVCSADYRAHFSTSRCDDKCIRRFVCGCESGAARRWGDHLHV